MMSNRDRQQQRESETDGLIKEKTKQQQNHGWTIQTPTAGKRKSGKRERSLLEKRCNILLA